MSLISQNVRNVLQCRSNTLKKKRCRKRTAHTSKCWIHLAKENNLRVKKSRIPNAGKGLYAWKKTFGCLSDVVDYTGKKTTMAEMDRKYGSKTIAQYSLCDGPHHCVDAYKSTHGPARFCNDARGSRYKNNSCFTGTTRHNNRFKLQTTSAIKPHQEILADYGDEYWPRGYLKKKQKMSKNRRNRNVSFRGKKRQRGGSKKKIQKVLKIMKDFESTKKKIFKKIKSGVNKVKKFLKKQFGGVQPSEDRYQQFGGMVLPNRYYLN